MNDAAGAERHLLAAVIANEAAGTPTWTAMAQLDLAELYLHGAESDSDTKSTTLVPRPPGSRGHRRGTYHHAGPRHPRSARSTSIANPSCAAPVQGASLQFSAQLARKDGHLPQRH